MKIKISLLVFIFCLHSIAGFSADFIIIDKNIKSSIVYDGDGPAIDSITAHLLAEDIQRVTGYLPFVFKDISQAKGNVIVIGNLQSKLMSNFIDRQSSINKNVNDKWECYELKIIDKPLQNINKALLIVGSDNRGTAYGVFDISERIGVSPWYWWADVVPIKQKELSLNFDEYVSSPPSVKYRGIFLNDEDWGLQPWAAKTFEPQTGDIGPKTYAKIFELLLRLKANLIWPAMHPSTKAFYHYPGNKKVVADYCIVIGSSHAEPMLRNNVGEWNEKTMGAFNYITNKQKVYNYWEERVKESRKNDAMYTLGMRGVHDSGIEGVKSSAEAVPLLDGIIKDQREMLQKYIHKNIADIPQVFTVYKEVLEIYESGLQIPDDVTIVWPDDNYGYIQRLSDEQEQKRSGGSGIYYHASYWGRPHDYLWLSSTHPSLIREEMMKAYDAKANKLWVLNVGDIKPLEYNIQMFLDMAYNAEPFKDSRYVKRHMLSWITKIFGSENAESIQNILWQYYQLAFERRPEFMGWSQTEPTTKTNYTSYDHFNYGDEAQKRIDSYDELEKQVKQLQKKINAKDADAFYELVYYPVVGASLMNKKFIYRDKSFLYAKQNRQSAFDYALWSQQAYDDIVKETEFYNNKLANGKWENIMSMKPRDLPVYQSPVLSQIVIDTTSIWSIAPEGDSAFASSEENYSLPKFNSLSRNKYFIDIFLSGKKIVNWTSSSTENWIKLSQQTGILFPEAGKKQTRLWVDIDWNKAPKNDRLKGTIIFNAGDKQIPLKVYANNLQNAELQSYKGFVENNGYVSIYASNYSRQLNQSKVKWEIKDGLGHSVNSLESTIDDKFIFSDKDKFMATAPRVEYDFYTATPAAAEINMYSLPTFPLNKNYSMRYAVAIDNAPPKIVDFRTVGRSEEWKQNVLSNEAVRKIKTQFLEKGKHVLKIYMIDPGVILDRITIDLGGLRNAYSTISETRLKSE
ncbi:MAG TPA: glycosyl hydrolase 115 family protein [Chitinophagaceae bacterium]